MPRLSRGDCLLHVRRLLWGGAVVRADQDPVQFHVLRLAPPKPGQLQFHAIVNIAARGPGIFLASPLR